MRRRSTAALALIGIAVGVALAGCGGLAPGLAHPTTARPTHPLSTPGSTPAALVAPRSAIARDCAELLPGATAAALFPAASAVVPQESQATPPQDLIGVAQRQAGGLHCLWGGVNRTDNGYDDMIDIEVLQDAATAYRDSADAIAGDSATHGGVGDAAAVSCDGDPHFFCDAQILIGTTWLEVDYNSLGGDGEPTSGAIDRFHTLLTSVVHQVQTAGAARTLWTPPAAWDGAGLCDTGALAKVQAATGVSGLSETDYGPEPPLTAATVTLARVPVQECGWARTTDSGISLVGIDFVQGGAWALTQEADDPSHYYFGTMAPVTVPGATSALALCNGEACFADLSISGSWLRVALDGLDSTDTLVHDVAALLAANPH